MDQGFAAVIHDCLTRMTLANKKMFPRTGTVWPVFRAVNRALTKTFPLRRAIQAPQRPESGITST
jgi:hypothetical protein